MAHKYLKSVLSQNGSDSCLRPCTTVSYEASFRKMSHNSRTLSNPTNNMITDYIKFGLVYEDFEVTTNHEYYVMNKEALISDVGGFIGLFLGFSFLSICNWIFDNCNEYWKITK